MTATEEQIRAAAAAIANARAMRRGAPAIGNVLDVLSKLQPNLLEEVTEDATEALKAAGIGRSYPTTITPSLEEVLGMMVFQTGPLGRLFRDAGYAIASKVEAEQAFVLHWLIGLALEHGNDWRKVAALRIDTLTAVVKGGGRDPELEATS